VRANDRVGVESRQRTVSSAGIFFINPPIQVRVKKNRLIMALAYLEFNGFFRIFGGFDYFDTSKSHFIPFSKRGI
jgi:hypothetical protein